MYSILKVIALCRACVSPCVCTCVYFACTLRRSATITSALKSCIIQCTLKIERPTFLLTEDGRETAADNPITNKTNKSNN